MSYGGNPEAERLAGIHSQAGAGLGVAPAPVCDLCEDGDTPQEGWHMVQTSDDWEEWTVTRCPRN